MKWFLLLALLIMAFPAMAFAQAQKNKTASVPPQLKVEGEVAGPIPSKVINDMYESCLYHIPDRFTPDARKYYCACNAAATQGNFLMSEFIELQQPSKRVPTNKTFEKYVVKAVAPCLDMPVKQIEYISCLVESSYDIRLGSVPAFCNCVAGKIQKHAMRFADTEILTRMQTVPRENKDPVEALWYNPTYISAQNAAYNSCMINNNQ